MTQIVGLSSPYRASVFARASITVACLFSTAAVAQVSDDPYSPRATGSSATGTQSSDGRRETGAPQVETPESAPYRPAEISSERRVTSTRQTVETSREEADEQMRQRALRAKITAPSEYEAFVSQVIGRPLRRFGANLLVPAARDFTTPPTATVPADYRLNPGDELSVGLTGSIEANDLRLVVDPQGRIFVPRIGAINVGGIRYGDVQSVLTTQISRQYKNFRVAVTIGRLRGITVYVTGFAATPGSYSVSSLSTVVNAVLAAGGPSAGGSFRSIQVRRGGRLISDFDLYDLLLRGDKSGDAVLQNGDVIYIAPIGAQVAVIGSVNNEAIFEAAPGEKISDLILDAGGVNTVADQTRALVLDPLKPEGSAWEKLTPQEASTRIVTRGLIIRVLSGVGLSQPINSQSVLVTISGEVAKPGRYYMRPGTRLAEVLGEAGGLTAQAYSFGTVINRDSVQALQQTSYERALRELEFSLSLKPLVSIADNRQLTAASDLEAARTIIDQLRRRKPDGRLVLDMPFITSGLPGDLLIENNDTIYVPPRATSVGVFGSVNNPASFYYSGSGTVGDFVGRAGGIQKFGSKSGTFVVRANGAVFAGSNIFAKPALPGDLIFVPINATRGEFWQRVRDIASLLSQAAVPVAVVATIAK
jgi:polysaccharide biosynthesis/export protein